MGPPLNPMGSNLQILGVSMGGPWFRRGGYMPSLFSWFLGSTRLLTAASAQDRRLGRVWLYASLWLGGWGRGREWRREAGDGGEGWRRGIEARDRSGGRGRGRSRVDGV